MHFLPKPVFAILMHFYKLNCKKNNKTQVRLDFIPINEIQYLQYNFLYFTKKNLK